MSVWYNENLDLIGLKNGIRFEIVVDKVLLLNTFIGPIESCGWVYIGEFE